MGVKFIRNPAQADQAILFNFDTICYRFLVKNLTEGDIYVAPVAGAEKTDSLLIPAGCAQVLCVNERDTWHDASSVVQVIADETSEKGVEIQCIRY